MQHHRDHLAEVEHVIELALRGLELVDVAELHARLFYSVCDQTCIIYLEVSWLDEIAETCYVVLDPSVLLTLLLVSLTDFDCRWYMTFLCLLALRCGGTADPTLPEEDRV